jgi:hypothetical protein
VSFRESHFFRLGDPAIYPVPAEWPFLALFFFFALFVPFRGYFVFSILAFAAWREFFFCFWLSE